MEDERDQTNFGVIMINNYDSLPLDIRIDLDKRDQHHNCSMFHPFDYLDTTQQISI